VVSDPIETKVPRSERRRVVERIPLDPLRQRCVAAYRAGPRLDDAVAVCRRLAQDGLASTIGYAASRGERAADAAAAHRQAFERLAAEDLDCLVSVKLSALGFDERLFAELVAAAAQSGRRLHVDALAPETAGPTWRLLEGARSGARLGGTLPGRWPRSPDDAARAVELGLPVRVVKGQWSGGVEGTVDAVEGFLRVVDRLRGHTAGVAVATHATALLDESLRRLTAARTPCEAELLYGLPLRAPALVARRLGVPIRIYVPYGDAGAPYGADDLIRRPAAAWWLVQDLLLGKDKPWRAIRRLRDQP
jgi:proline dehydrogenase